MLQEPGINYEFNGGTSISFDAAPTSEDDIFIFYRGTVGQDSFIFDVNETIKEGDIINYSRVQNLNLTMLLKIQLILHREMKE